MRSQTKLVRGRFSALGTAELERLLTDPLAEIATLKLVEAKVS